MVLHPNASHGLAPPYDAARPVATGRAADVRAVTELLLPARMMIHSGMLSAVLVVILAVGRAAS